MHTQQCQKMDMDGKNYSVKGCVDIFMKILDLKQELQDTTMYMDQWEHTMEEEKKHQQLCVEKLFRQKITKIIR